MRQYVKNILLYVAALLCLVAFIGLFANSLEIYDRIKDTWSVFKVEAYLGEKIDNLQVYKGTIAPIFGFVLPLVIGIFLIVQSFRHRWSGYINLINTISSIVLFLCALLVLLTKELFLSVNNLGESVIIRNSNGPILAAICCCAAGILLMFTTWFPLKQDMKFIEKH